METGWEFLPVAVRRIRAHQSPILVATSPIFNRSCVLNFKRFPGLILPISKRGQVRFFPSANVPVAIEKPAVSAILRPSLLIAINAYRRSTCGLLLPSRSVGRDLLLSRRSVGGDSCVSHLAISRECSVTFGLMDGNEIPHSTTDRALVPSPPFQGEKVADPGAPGDEGVRRGMFHAARSVNFCRTEFPPTERRAIS